MFSSLLFSFLFSLVEFTPTKEEKVGGHSVRVPNYLIYISKYLPNVPAKKRNI